MTCMQQTNKHNFICIIMLEHMSIYTSLFFLDNIFISMYTMCVCLFSALSRRVGALQISIIIIIIIAYDVFLLLLLLLLLL